MRIAWQPYGPILLGLSSLVVVGRAMGPLGRTEGAALVFGGLMFAVIVAGWAIHSDRSLVLVPWLLVGSFVLLPAGNSYLPTKYGAGDFVSPIVLALGVPATVGLAWLFGANPNWKKARLDERLEQWFAFFAFCGGFLLLAVALMAAVDLATGDSPGPSDGPLLAGAAVGLILAGYVTQALLRRMPEEKRNKWLG